MVDIIIWRHAEAEVESNSGLDSERALTRKGQEDSHKMAKWLNQHLPAETKIYCSPALRCVQTLEALIKISRKENKRKVMFVDELSLNSNALVIRQKLTDSHSGSILLIGHQPILGELISDLCHPSKDGVGAILTNKLTKSNSYYAIKKGAVWWLRRKDSQANSAAMSIYNVQHPRLLS